MAKRGLGRRTVDSNTQGTPVSQGEANPQSEAKRSTVERPPSRSVDDLSGALAKLGGQGAPQVGQKSFGELRPRDIIRITNPRTVYCTHREVQATPWPSLSTDPAELESALRQAVEGQEWFTGLSARIKERAIKFFIEIHELACSMKDNGQLQPIIVERGDPASGGGQLLAGERRLIAALYSRGLIETLTAEIYNGTLSSLQRAIIRDQENNKSPLRYYETLISKQDIFKSLEGAADMSAAELAAYLGYRTRSVPSVLKRLFILPCCDQVIEIARIKDLGHRDIVKLIAIAEKDPAAIERRLRACQKEERGESSRGTEGADKNNKDDAGSQALKAAASHGLVIKPRTNKKLPRKLVELALTTTVISQKSRQTIEDLDLDTTEGLAEAWNTLAVELAGEEG